MLIAFREQFGPAVVHANRSVLVVVLAVCALESDAAGALHKTVAVVLADVGPGRAITGFVVAFFAVTAAVVLAEAVARRPPVVLLRDTLKGVVVKAVLPGARWFAFGTLATALAVA